MLQLVRESAKFWTLKLYTEYKQLNCETENWRGSIEIKVTSIYLLYFYCYFLEKNGYKY
jgi:hypothetical protein